MADVNNDANAENSSVTVAWSQTDLTVVPFRYLWTINNFRFVWYELGNTLESPAFSIVENGTEIKFCLLVMPKSLIGENKGFVSMHLELISAKNNSEVQLGRLMFSILNDKKEQKNVRITGQHKFIVGDPTVVAWGFNDFIHSNFLFDEVNAGLLPGGKLTIVCVGTVKVKRVDISGKNMLTSKYKVPECQLSDDLSLLLNQQKHTNVIISVSGREFKAHKYILAARSSVFADMFEHKMEESKHNKVEITDIEPDVFKEMLRFIYSNKVLNIDEMAAGLLAAADKYALGRLKVMCEESLCKQLSTENAVEILQLADFHSASQLKEQATNFIVLHKIEVTKTSGWKSMISSVPRFAEGVFSSVSDLFSRMRVKDES